MHWRVKAGVQNLVAALPEDISYNLYFTLQRTVGRISTVDLLRGLRKGVRLIELIHAQGKTLTGATVVEVGTGRRCGVPLAFWLCGAQQIITVDVNPYLRHELIWADLQYLRERPAEIREAFGELALLLGFEERLMFLVQQPFANTAALLDATGIRYFSPADAQSLPLRAHSVDYHISSNVLEHIPPSVLAGIFHEAHRLLTPRGLFVHHIDLSDHFAHTDRSISMINFLRFDEATWQRYAGNRYMYQNRLRADDYLALLRESRLTVLADHARVDEHALQLLQVGFPLDTKFQAYTDATNATVNLTVVASIATENR